MSRGILVTSKLIFPSLSYVGEGALSNLSSEIEKLGVKKILVVTDQTLVDIGLCAKVLKSIEEKYHIDIYTDIIPEPPLEDAERLVKFTREGNFELIIGMGGGSAIDLAKLAAVISANEGKVSDYLNLTGTKQIKKKGLPKMMIPTTAGTGSEVTDISVLSLDGTKDVITHPYLLSDVAIVDPTVTLSVPKRVTAATGIDALTHAIEAYISVNANLVTDGISMKAIQLIGNSLKTAYLNGDNMKAREEMITASYLAGMAFYNAGVGGVHALAYPLGNKFKLPHGESNAVLLPYVVKHIKKSCEEKLANVVTNLDRSHKKQSNNLEDLSISCVHTLYHLVQSLDLPTSLQEYGIKEEDLSGLTKEALKQTRLLARSPLKLEENDIYKIYLSAFNGEISL
ncbi:iron-containing alcohol dehydrogenase [Evansella halocellulosilytica]|uniref:iron-containing alcohol dehydrogenase n=1 Tax=Evansella halocellulosilytica TaxID=2011013 RepID=UPI000BB805DF|nr:iron-containing alcohol dehydrogenase [Evansella halocellulosilytica]